MSQYLTKCTFAVVFALTMVIGHSSVAVAQNVDWQLHNLDLHGSRYADIDQITPENAHQLTPRWLFQHGVIDGVSNQTTPVIVDGIMYVTDSRGSVYAVDAYDGHHLWTYDVTELLGGGRREGYVFRHRGVTYENGVVYSAAGSFMFALDAKTGEPIETFGDSGQASVILDVLRLDYPEVETAISMGYWFTAAPQIHDGVLYVGSTRSESNIPGGHVLAVDATTGEVLWHFNTVPQDESDQGWDIAGPTWVGGEREGGGIWETPSIDPELGMMYIAVGNPFGPSDLRDGLNLFTDSVVALDLEDGQLQWYYQLVHHDVWDYDNGSQPILFDMEVDGEPVKALAQANKNGWVYLLDRETGQPIHPIIETPVITETDREGEEPWPTQPIPHKANGDRMEPASPVFPELIPPEHAVGKRLEEQFTPVASDRSNQIFAPGFGGGPSYGPMAHSKETGYLYVNAIDQPFNSGRGPRMFLSAYDPTTNELVWRQIYEGYGQSGPVVTSGGVVFVGTGSNIAGYFFALDAKTGEELYRFNTGAGVFSAPSVYMANGEQFVTVASGGGDRGRRGGDLILSFALPESN
ncbi:MAG: PQQ-binding-like beta-propeller repeat protein [Acidobacteriota bacterium]|nr:PQQ-binding-like beta-propeller repeat protein [Acidobacteriota bacterium]